MKKKSKLFVIGNQESILFEERVKTIYVLSDVKKFVIIDTLKNTLFKKLVFLYKSISLILLCLFRMKINVIFHGAYSPVLWLVVFFSNVKVISIIQGSEIEIDYKGYRSVIIKFLLNQSNLVLCRSDVQRQKIISLTSTRPALCHVINWGINKELFDIQRKVEKNYFKIISARATQSEYNIHIIFQVIKKLKEEGHKIRFCYIEFNKTVNIPNQDIIDIKIVNPDQMILWKEIASSDLSISIPKYDGFSNTIIETIALGTYNVCGELDQYNFFNNNQFIGKLFKFGRTDLDTAKNLYNVIKDTLPQIKKIRQSSKKRRMFALKNFSKGEGLDKIQSLINS